MSDSHFPTLQAIHVVSASPFSAEMVILATHKETSINGKHQKVFYVGREQESLSFYAVSVESKRAFC